MAAIDFLAEEELKAAEQIVTQIFDVKRVKPVRSVTGHKDATKARKEGKHKRIQEMLKKLMTAEIDTSEDLLLILGD